MSLTIGHIQGATERLLEIEQLAADPTVKQRLQKTFFPAKLRHEAETLAPVRPGGDPEYLLCNIVLQGGGVLGLAHVGFLAGLERAGVRFAGVAGTSAGAIVATALVCARKEYMSRSVSSELLDLVSRMPMSQFIDGSRPIRTLIKSFLKDRNIGRFSIWSRIPLVLSKLNRRRGLNPGVQFEQWLTEAFDSLGVDSSDTLITIMGSVYDELGKLGVRYIDREPEDMLRVIATAMPAGLKIVFPGNLNLFRDRYSEQSPALFVRASMAIPGFFEPQFMDVDRVEWRKEVDKRLKNLAPPMQIEDLSQIDTLGFVDGGLLSNLPVDAFDRMLMPKKGRAKGVAAGDMKFPTLVVTLVRWNPRDHYRFSRTSKGLIQDVASLFDAIRVQRDRDAKFRVDEDKTTTTMIVPIDTGDHDWLNFTMDEADMSNLFLRGLDRAVEFIRQGH